MTIISSMLLLAYGVHIVLILWYGQNLGTAELGYLTPMCLCLVVVWIWQSRHIPKCQDAAPLKMPRHSVSGVEMDELIEQHRLDNEIEAQREDTQQQKNDHDEQRFLAGVQEWQARQRWMQDGS